MKKDLTHDITRYDSKMKIRLNRKTALTAIRCLAIGTAVFLVCRLWFSGALSLTAAIIVFCFSAIITLSERDGVSLGKFWIGYIKKIVLGSSDKYNHVMSNALIYQKTTKGEKMEEETSKKRSGLLNILFPKKEKTKEKAKSRQNTAQSMIPFSEWYDSGMFRIGEDTYTVIASFTPAGYLSKTESEQSRKYNSYQKALCELPQYVHYEECIYNRPIDPKRYRQAVASKQDGYKDDYEKAFYDVQRKMLDTVSGTYSAKEHLIALSVKVSKIENPSNKLQTVIADLTERFREMGSKLTVLDPSEIFRHLSYFYNPYGGKCPDITPNLYMRGFNIKDVICPDGIICSAQHLRLGDAYCRVFYVQSYGSTVYDTLTYHLLNNDHHIAVSKHIDHVSKEEAVKNIKAQMAELSRREQGIRSRNHAQGTTYVPSDLIYANKGCEQMLEALRSEEILRQTYYITVFGESPEDLKERIESIRTTVSTEGCILREEIIDRKKAFDSVLPLGKDYLNHGHQILSSEAAIITPFSYESLYDDNGFLYGFNEYSGEPVIINRKADKSSNGMILGLTGSGKGIYVKHEISNIIYQRQCSQDRILIIDPSGEYVPIAKAAGGQVIELAPSGDTHLNPLYISAAQKDILGSEKAVASKIAALIALLTQLKSEPLTAIEKSIADEIAGKCLNSILHKPTLNVFYDQLLKDERAEAKQMCNWLSRYVTGSVTLFSGENTEVPNNRITVYTVGGLPGDLLTAGMLAMIDRIEEQIMINHNSGHWTWIYIDEMHRFFDYDRNPYAAERFARLYSEARKYGAILTGITQLPKPVIQSRDGATMLSNSRFICMAELDRDNIEAVSSSFDLNDDHKRTLRAPNVGQYVLRTNSAPMSISLVYPGAKPQDKNLMFDIFNTSFSGGGTNEKQKQ